MVTQEEMNYYKQMEEELTAERDRSRQLGQGMQSQMNMFNSEEQDNLIRWQLDLKEDLDRIYHLLRGDQVGEDKDGNIIYISPKDDNLKPFSESGVQLIMNVMAFYLNRNTILSNYSEQTIDWKILDFGNELADLIFNKYEEMGMNTPQKRKMYPMIVKELVDTIHSAYLRAYHGGERESLRTARTVTQSEPLSRGGVGFQQPMNMKKRSWYNPITWTS